MARDVLPFIKDYRPNKFVIKVDTQEGCLLYNTATVSIAVLDGEEDLRDSFEELKKMNDYVPLDFDEIAWVDELRRAHGSNSQKNGIHSFTILTTTECNARCFYCYEKGQHQKPMSDDTARDVAAYIASVSPNSPVDLHWFGGEPLYNPRVIDIISNLLTEKGIKYQSTMISNGLLFTDSIIRKAKETWKLKRVQITLDGTKDVYQKSKAYKNANGDEFDRVIDSIRRLSEAGIHVSIRLNQEFYNTEDLLELVLFLSETFKGDKHISVYNNWLYSEKNEKDILLEEKKYEQFNRLQERIIDLGLYSNPTLKKRMKYSHCMADNDSAVLITPSGEIGKCEHYTDQHLIGSIYDQSFDEVERTRWKETYPTTAKCFDCPLYPQCYRIKMCPIEGEQCSWFECENRIELIKSALLQSI
jgi:radical SAM protein with 4Fe4S-binding SPASM domain